jgi:hypothetical protein
MVNAMKLKLSILVSSIPLLLVLMSMVPRSADKVDASTGSEQAVGTAASSAVLVELFTSEGCSSCPPADKLLSELDQVQPIKGVQVIPLSEHVDYWDRLGWKDPFSSAEFTRRQSEYGRVLAVEDIYTPQMVVDGRTEFTGNKRATAFDAIAKAARAPKGDVRITIKAAGPGSVTLTVQVENLPDVARGDTADLMLALTESGLLSKVSRGENSGRDLAHSAVTRKLIKIGTVNGTAFSAERNLHLDSPWKRQNMKIVAFVQERNSRRVLGATAIKLSADA